MAVSFSENFAAQKLAQTAKRTICALEGLGPIRMNAVLLKRELLVFFVHGHSVVDEQARQSLKFEFVGILENLAWIL